MALDGRLKVTLAKIWRKGQQVLSQKRCLTILYYHAVPDEDAANFAAQMEHLAKNAELVFADCETLPETDKPIVAVSFDDAFESVADNALPVMERLGIPTTIYVPTGWLGKTPGWAAETADDADEKVMDADRLKTILNPLVRLGSHTIDHPRLTQLDPEAQQQQFKASRDFLEDLTGSVVDTIAFPYGDYDRAVAVRAREAGYRQLYTVFPQAILADHTGALRGRTSVEANDPLSLFDLKLHGAFAWMPAAIALKRRLMGRSQQA